MALSQKWKGIYIATLGSTNVVTNITASKGAPLSFAGGIGMEIFRVTGGAVGDTIALGTSWIKNITSCVPGLHATHDVTTSSTNVVTLTLKASAATTLFHDVIVFGKLGD